MEISGTDRPIMFWRSDSGTEIIAEIATAVFLTGKLLPNPRACIRGDIPPARRTQAALILASGKIGISYMGWADCRICGATLGTNDRHGYGFMWPEKAEHYVLEHGVWVPELDLLIDAYERSK